MASPHPPPPLSSDLEEEEDRITNLPESLLHQILTLLDTKQVVQTSILSTNWRHFWRSIQTLDFSDLNWYLSQTGKTRKFKRAKFRFFIDSVLLMRDTSDLHKFSLYFSSSSPKDCNRLDRWIMYAIKRNVKVLTFGATEFFHYNVLRLAGNVKKLELKGVFLHDYPKNDGELVMDFPVVEELLLEECGYCEIKRLVVVAPKLEYFTIVAYNDTLNSSTSIKILSPKLRSFYCKGFMFRDYILEDLADVALVDFDTIIGNSDKDVKRMDGKGFGRCLSKIFKGLENMKYLILSAHGLQSFAKLSYMLDWDTVLCKRLVFLKLKLITWSNNAYIHPLAKLLGIFPSMEFLILERNETLAELETEETDSDWEKQLSFECVLPRLRVIKYHNLQVCENELKFIAFLMRSAIILEKMTISIVIRSSEEVDKVLEFMKKLLLLPQASPDVDLCYTFIPII
ncbi:hypothetical protein ACHQM5_017181 [Ranunculus cassubicifolius]